MAEKDTNFFKPEEKLSTGESLAVFIWNPRTREFCGRTGSSWIKILVFYIIFYLCLAAFWALMLLIFYQTIDDRVPKWQLGDSRIGSNPGLGFRPRPRDENVESTLIWFKQGRDEKNWKHWTENLDKFLEPYEKGIIESGGHLGNCDNNKTVGEGEFCRFDIRKIDNNCTKGLDFGYKRGDPCVLIKLNRIYNWKPTSYELSDLEKDSSIPDSVRDGYKKNRSDIVYVTCEGENAADKENIGPLDYYPQPGIEFKYFPFTNQPGYLSPFVFVHFSKPTPGVLINIECKAWAKNIKHDRMDREGSVHFELLIDGF
jgi:sodium/potassium-transporting ATPase subunit beta